MRLAFWCSLVLILGLPVGCRRGGNKGRTPVGDGVAVAKLIVQPTGGVSDGGKPGALDDFYDAQIAILKGSELNAEALQNTLDGKLDPTAKPVTLKVARMADVITLIGRSESPQFASSFLNALIEGYVKKVQGVIADEKDLKTKADSVRARKAAAEKELREAEKNLTLFKLEHESAHAETERATAQAKIKRLESARAFYQSELDLSAKADLETDLQRRRTLLIPPSDMPEEFLRLINSNLTPNEQAYVDALARNDPATTKATRLLAEGDQKARIESFQLQLGTVKQLAADLQKRLKEIETNDQTAREMSAVVDKARQQYEQLKLAEHDDDPGRGTGQKRGVLVTIIEKPAAVPAEK